ncbi:DNA-binding protein [Oceanobacter kriegii]|uniref:DNA-binding protein n=1 Tax=Oceanobacter kriegii TaxID=64972 RepID=UPI00041B65F3|nr:DNA-binding protein [Oceanobacter kriegii]
MSIEEKIIAACKELESTNQPVTNVSVRNLLGSGSMSTIAPIVREYKTGQPKATKESPEWFNELSEKLWKKIESTMKREMEREIARIQKDCDQLVKNAENERDKALLECDRLRVILKETENGEEIAQVKEDYNQLSENYKEKATRRISLINCARSNLGNVEYSITSLLSSLKGDAISSGNYKAVEIAEEFLAITRNSLNNNYTIYKMIEDDE